MWTWLALSCASPPAPFHDWVEPNERRGARWLALNLLEDEFAAQLDQEPLVYEELPSIREATRSGWILEGTQRVEDDGSPSRWRVRVLEMNERYTDCAADGPWPMHRGAEHERGAIRLPADEGDHYDCEGSTDIVLEPVGKLVEVTYCGHSFVARPRDSLARRYEQARDAWSSAEIARLGLKTGSEPANIVHQGRELECVPATLFGAGRQTRLACDSPSGEPFLELWFDTDGQVREGHLHNECGWFGIDPEGH